MGKHHQNAHTTLNFYRRTWTLDLADCPCDLHFVQYLEAKRIEGKLIFHFGTGDHHIVGKRNHERGNPNEIFAITASCEPHTLISREHLAYVDFIINHPAAANYYRVLFADIYTLSARMLPNFDLVTLFHLCEYYDDREYFDNEDYGGLDEAGGPPLNSAYARLNDAALLDLFVSKLNPGGKLFFFKQSAGWDEAAKLIADFVSQGKMVIAEEYESLLICGRP